MAIWDVPRGVPAPVLIVKVTVAGLPEIGDTVLEGWNMQAAPAGKPLQERVTAWLNAPEAVTSNATGPEVLDGFTVRLAGAGVARLKSTTCRVKEKSRVVVLASLPTP